jgi:WD40 repeat protein
MKFPFRELLPPSDVLREGYKCQQKKNNDGRFRNYQTLLNLTCKVCGCRFKRGAWLLVAAGNRANTRLCSQFFLGVWLIMLVPLFQAVLTASGDKTVRIWSLADGTCLKTFEGHTASVLRATFLSRGTQIVSAGQEMC